MTWQEPIVALIVGLAVVSLYRHVRSMLGLSKAESHESCHGCDDCATNTEPASATEVRDGRPT